MRQRKIAYFVPVLMVLLFLTGCVRDYRAEAADQAAEYLLKNLEGLSVLQQNHIRYNRPIILNTVLWTSMVPAAIPDGHIVARHERNVYRDGNRDMMMQCFGWRVPGMDKDVFVVGTAQKDFRFWEPQRIVLRSREKEDLAGMTIRMPAMKFAIEAYPELEGKIFHKIRYTTPEVYSSGFILDVSPKEETKDSWLDFLKIENEIGPVQVSAVWTDPVSKKKIIIVGISEDEKLKKWIPARAYEMSEKEAKTYLGSKYTVFEDDKDDPFQQNLKLDEEKKSGKEPELQRGSLKK